MDQRGSGHFARSAALILGKPGRSRILQPGLLMRALALATDYDRTLATEGRVRNGTLRALRRFKDSGRKLILVTGRELPDLLKVFPEHGIFDRIVAENGALLYDPATRERTALGPEADSRLVHRLRRRGIKPLSVGHTIVATEEPHEREVLEAIH